MRPIIHIIARIFSMIPPPSKFVFPFTFWLLSPILKIGGGPGITLKVVF